jgi:hypothetical protein
MDDLLGEFRAEEVGSVTSLSQIFVLFLVMVLHGHFADMKKSLRMRYLPKIIKHRDYYVC